MRSRAIFLVCGVRERYFMGSPCALAYVSVSDVKKGRGCQNLPDTNLPPFDHETFLTEESDRFGQAAVFMSKDPGGKCILIITFENGNALLDNDRAAIKTFINEMDSASRHFDTMPDCLPLPVQPGKRGEERRVNIDHSSGKCLHDLSPDNPHVAGKHDQVGIAVLHRMQQCLLIGIPGRK